jgi:hypothetical protein
MFINQLINHYKLSDQKRAIEDGGWRKKIEKEDVW